MNALRTAMTPPTTNSAHLSVNALSVQIHVLYPVTGKLVCDKQFCHIPRLDLYEWYCHILSHDSMYCMTYS